MWQSLALPAIALVASLARPVAGQVTSDCNPMNETCPPNEAFGMDYTFHFNTTPPDSAFEVHAGTIEYSGENGAEFTINEQGDSPTLRSKFYIFGGRTELIMKASHGRGVVSSMMWLSDTLDEVDWEFLGTNETHALTNYYGKGIEHHTEGEEHVVPGGTIQDEFHNYTLTWTEERLEWYIDGESVRVLHKGDALEDGNLYPQTPMRLYIGIWAGGDPDMPKGTREWAGGDTNYDEGPFTMYVQKAHVTDYSSGKEYVYGDDSGNWESIEIVDEGKNSTVKEDLLKEPEKSISEKFDELPEGAKIAVYASSAGVGAALLGGLLFYCFRQRRRGATEAAAAAKRAEDERLEMDPFQKPGLGPEDLASPTVAGFSSSPDVSKQGYTEESYYEVPVSGASPLNGGEKYGWDQGVAPMGAAAVTRPQSRGMGSPSSQRNFSNPTRTPSPSMPPKSPTSPGPQTFGDMNLDPFHDKHATNRRSRFGF